MSKKLLQLIKQASKEAESAGKPVEFTSGTVVSEKPLIIMTEQKLRLTADFLTLTNAVRDRFVDMEISAKTETAPNHKHNIESSTETSDGHSYTIDTETQNSGEHSHSIKGIKRIKLCDGLKNGEKVLLIRWQGGQRYIVLDRCGGESNDT